jgi:hypothetical protein
MVDFIAHGIQHGDYGPVTMQIWSTKNGASGNPNHAVIQHGLENCPSILSGDYQTPC